MAPPLTTREFAYFNVTGPGTHEEITAILGLRPSEAWNAGDINARNGRPRKFMNWTFRSGEGDTRPLNAHIASLFLCLGLKKDALRALWVDYDLTLVCVGYFPMTGHGLHLDREQVRQAAQLGLAFDFDFYYNDDRAHER